MVKAIVPKPVANSSAVIGSLSFVSCTRPPVGSVDGAGTDSKAYSLIKMAPQKILPPLRVKDGRRVARHLDRFRTFARNLAVLEKHLHQKGKVQD